MNSRIDQITKGLISLAIMLMFAVAFIAGQARANLPSEDSLLDDEAQEYNMRITFDTQPLLIDMLLALPIDIDIGLNDLSLRSDTPDDAGSETSLIQ